MSNVSVSGMVISSMPIGEYDRRLELLSGECGRISVFARGARKPSSDLVAVSRVFATGRFELFQGKSSYTLSSASVSEYFTGLSEDIDLTYYGFYFLELAKYFTRENVEAGDILNLVYLSLKALQKETFDPRLVRAVFEIKMLQLNGLCPEAAEVLKPEGKYVGKEKLNDAAAYAVKFILASDIPKLYTFRLGPEALADLADISGRLMELNVDKKFKSLEYING